MPSKVEGEVGPPDLNFQRKKKKKPFQGFPCEHQSDVDKAFPCAVGGPARSVLAENKPSLAACSRFIPLR